MSETKRKPKIPFALKVVQKVYPVVEAIAPFIAKKWAVKLFFSPLKYPVPRKERDAEAEATKYTLVHNGLSLQVYTWGKGDKLALVTHGWSGRGTQFYKFVPSLINNGYTVVAFDGPAHHQSEGKITTLPDFTSSIHAIAEKFGTPEVLISHSLGGVAAIHALVEGLDVKKLITISSPSISEGIINGFLKTVNGSNKTASYILRYIKDLTGKEFQEFSASLVVKQLPIKTEYLIVHDDHDKEVSLYHAQALKEGYPDAQLHITHQLGHTKILRNKDVVDKITGFIFATNKILTDERV